MKGIILAGGPGSRLYPVTTVVSKQLLPVFDKPMIYYPLSTLMLAGIRDILIISTPQDKPLFRAAAWAMAPISACVSPMRRRNTRAVSRMRSLSVATLSATDPVALVLGDNIFYGHGLPEMLAKASARAKGATVFGYVVNTPEQYGVVELDASGRRALDRGEADAPEIERRGHRTLFLRQRRGGHRRAASSLRRAARSRSPTSTGPIWSAAISSSRCSAAALPGSTPAPTPRWSRPATSSRSWSSGRACGLPARRKSHLRRGYISLDQFRESWRSAAPRAATANICCRSHRSFAKICESVAEC